MLRHYKQIQDSEKLDSEALILFLSVKAISGSDNEIYFSMKSTVIILHINFILISIVIHFNLFKHRLIKLFKKSLYLLKNDRTNSKKLHMHQLSRLCGKC